MIVGLAACECMIYNAHSLKEKRAVLQRIMTRLKQKLIFLLQKSTFKILGKELKLPLLLCLLLVYPAEIELQNALKFIDSFPEMERTITDIEWL